jgi:HPt (histidine-containing phosphotransfer) domain-containing protein
MHRPLNPMSDRSQQQPPTAALPADPQQPAADAWAALMQVLDAESLQRLRELDPTGATGLLPRVLQAYQSSAARLLAQLDEARGRGDLQGVRHVAHTLKSSSASIGALQLSALCAEAERRARDGTADGLDDLLDRMVAESGRVLAALAPALVS